MKTNKSVMGGMVAAVAAVAVLASPAYAGVVATDAGYGVFDANAGTRTLKVAQHGSIKDLNIAIDFAKCDDVAVLLSGSACGTFGNAFNNEIFFQLTSPDGTTVILINVGTYTSGSAGVGRLTLTLDDSAVTAAGGNTLTGGSFRAASALSAFNGKEMFGNWTLLVIDNAGADPLTYFGSRLDITGAAVAEVPEPASFALLGLGMLGLLGARRRKQG